MIYSIPNSGDGSAGGLRPYPNTPDHRYDRTPTDIGDTSLVDRTLYDILFRETGRPDEADQVGHATTSSEAVLIQTAGSDFQVQCSFSPFEQFALHVQVLCNHFACSRSSSRLLHFRHYFHRVHI